MKGVWTQADAHEWWTECDHRRAEQGLAATGTIDSLPTGWQVDVDDRSSGT